MAKFVKGMSGNPGGQRKIDPGLKEHPPMTKKEVAHVIGKYSRMNLAQIMQAQKDPNTPRFDLAIIACIEKAIEEGDAHNLEFLLNRTIGKVREELDIQVIKPFVIGHLSGEKTILGSQIEKDPLLLDK